jgi:CheY-like chemotaxis protein
MPRILVVDPDLNRGSRLKHLVRARLDVEVVLTLTADAAITKLAERTPDLILVSTLMAPQDDVQLATYLKRRELRHVPVLTISPLVEVPHPKRSFLTLFGRRRATAWPTYDIEVIVNRIRDAFELTQSEEHWPATDFEELGPPEDDQSPAEPLAPEHPDLDQALLALCGVGERRPRAPRWTSSDLPWLSSVALSGVEVRLLNISSSGLLVESGVRFIAGSSTTFHLSGPGEALVAPARVVRSHVAAVDALGVRYHAAVLFEQTLEALIPVTPPTTDERLPQALADLVAHIKSEAERGCGPVLLRSEFERGIRQLVSAREIRLRDVPVVDDDGSESVYFTVPTTDDSQAVLQVTFEPGYRPAAKDFEVLKAAATAASDILQITAPVRHLNLVQA